MSLGWGEEQHKASASGTQHFATPGAAARPGAVNLVYLGVADALIETTLGLPRFIEQFAKLPERPPAGKDIVAAKDHVVHCSEHRGIVGHFTQLLGGDVGGLALDAGEDEKEVLLEFSQPFRQERHPFYFDLGFRAELDEVKTAKGGKDLVLAADIFPQDMSLEVNGLAGQLVRIEELTLEAVERMQQSDGEGRGRTEAGEGGEVGYVVQFDIFFKAAQFEALAEYRVLDLPDVFGQFDLPVRDADRIIKEMAQERAGGDIGEIGRAHV